nr:MobF family relaxase [Jiangella mangrovi]
MRVLTAGEGYRYLLRSVAAGDGNRSLSTPLTRYYQEKGTPPGFWLGTGVHGFGDGTLTSGDVVTEAQLRRLLGRGLDPLTGEPLGRCFYQFKPVAVRVAVRAARLSPELSPEQRTESMRQIKAEEAARSRPRTVAGYDLTFSVPKSVSVLWGLADVGTQAMIVHAHHDAIADVIALLERDVAMTRTGTGGVAQIETLGVAATAFDHYDSRASDPQLHTHVVIANRVQGRDGRWRTLDGRPMHAAVVALSEHYNSVLADHLTRALGVGWERRTRGEKRNPSWEIVGISDDLISEFSARAADIEVQTDRLIAEYILTHGRCPSRRTVLQLRQRATLETRPEKEVRSLAERTVEWRHRAGRILDKAPADWACSVVTTSVDRAVLRADDLPLAVVDELARTVVERVGQKRSTWRRWNLYAEASRQLMHLRFAATADREAVIGMVVDAAERVSLRLTPPELAATPAEFRRADGSSVFRPKHGVVYSSTSVLAAEDRLLRLAENRAAPTVDLEAVAGATAVEDVVLAGDQVLAIEKIAVSGRIVDVLVGPAGTGKTTTLGGLRRAWEAEFGSGSVVGLAPSATAADVLGADLGITTETTAKWLYEYEHGRWQLHRGQLVVLDEASLAGTFALDTIAANVATAGAKLVLVGDWAQLDAVDTSGAFGLLVRSRDDAPELADVRRFSEDWEKSASLELRLGRPDAIRRYEAHGRVAGGESDVMLDTAYRAWAQDLAAGKATLLIADDAETVSSLNARARNDRMLAGDVGDGGVQLADGNRASGGDLVITRQNDRRLSVGTGWVKNGDRWIVTANHADGALTVWRADGRWRGTVTLPSWYVAEHVDLGYAITAHRAQGATVDTSHVIVRSPAMTREAFYVAMSRGRQSNAAYVATDRAHLEEHQRSDGDDPTARSVLQAVLRNSASALSAHEMIRTEQETWTSIAQLAAEYETIAQHAEAEHVATLLAIGGLDDRQLDQVVRDDAYGSLVAELRRASANGFDPAAVVRHTVLAGSLERVDNLTTLLRHRVQKLTGSGRIRTPARDSRRLVVGLLPRAVGAMTEEMAAVLAELEELMERRADANVDAAVAAGEPWVLRCGRPPQEPAMRQAWTDAVRVVAAYRDLHRVGGDEPVGPVPSTDRERIDFNRAVRALRDARARAAGPRDEARPVLPAVHRLDSFSS